MAYSSIPAVGGVSAFLGGALPQVEATSTQPHVDSSVVTEAPHQVESNVSDTSTEADPGSVKWYGLMHTYVYLPRMCSVSQEPSFQTAFSSASGDKPLVGEATEADAIEVNTCEVTSPSMPQEPPSSSIIDPMLQAGEDTIGGSEDAKAEEVAGRGVKPTNVGQPDGFQRYSKRLRPRKQEALKRPRRAMKEKEAVSAVKSTIPITETTRFVGGFTPLLPPTPTRRAAFLRAIQNAKNLPATEADAFQMDTLMTVFECSRVVSQEAIDRVVAYIRKRREGLPSCRFDFLDSAFFSELLRNFPDFNACNSACPSVFALTSVITPISIMLPHLIGCYCMTDNAQQLHYAPLTMSRLEIPCLVEHPGCSSVVALMFLELHAIGKELNSVYFNEEHVRTAAENYAIETLQMCQPGSVPPAEYLAMSALCVFDVMYTPVPLGSISSKQLDIIPSPLWAME
ncbi:hypothetical protein YC2023_009982 [Brassica napus]